jgi:hypothetical protein
MPMSAVIAALSYLVFERGDLAEYFSGRRQSCLGVAI